MNKDIQLIWEAYQLKESATEGKLQSEPTPENLEAYLQRDLAFVDAPLYRDVVSQSPSGHVDDPGGSKIKDYVTRVLEAAPESRRLVFDMLTKTLTNKKLHFIFSADEARWLMGDTDQAPDLSSSRDRINPEEAQRQDAERQQTKRKEFTEPVNLPPAPPPPRNDPYNDPWGPTSRSSK